MKKEVGELVRFAEDRGYTFDRYTGTGHYRMVHGRTGGVVIIPATPSDPRWKKNVIADIRRNSK